MTNSSESARDKALRQHAEKRVYRYSVHEDLSPEVEHKLLLELREHQIELRLQNEKLRSLQLGDQTRWVSIISSLSNKIISSNHIFSAISDFTRRKREQKILFKTNDLLNATERLAHIGIWHWLTSVRTLKLYYLKQSSGKWHMEHIPMNVKQYGARGHPVIFKGHLLSTRMKLNWSKTYTLPPPFSLFLSPPSLPPPLDFLATAPCSIYLLLIPSSGQPVKI